MAYILFGFIRRLPTCSPNDSIRSEFVPECGYSSSFHDLTLAHFFNVHARTKSVLVWSRGTAREGNAVSQ
ncbi:hypothetical protein BDR04DRAFT_1110234 [Suillus decipiens]|nr:hypothetical protein BDR04DRAFT_1110234 [Suillus decipiens]